MALFKVKQGRDFFDLEAMLSAANKDEQDKPSDKGVFSKPSKAQQDPEVLTVGFLSDFFSRSDEYAKELQELSRRSAEEAALSRMESGITESLAGPARLNKLKEGESLVPKMRPEAGFVDADPLPKAIEERSTITEQELPPAEVEETATPSGGLMSRMLDEKDSILPPESSFIKSKDTTAGEAEREIYKDAYQAGLSGDELKAFMAQVAHESSSFGRIKERGYDWSKNYNGFSKAWKDRLKRDGVTAANGTAENIFNSVYANQNGNGDYASGDGSRYKGRGYIQLTGKDNYRIIGNDIGEDLVGNPDLMLDPAIARKASIAWWKRNVRGNVPNDDYTNINAVSGLVNRGSATRTASGLDDRKEKYDIYNQKVTTLKASPRPIMRPEEEE